MLALGVRLEHAYGPEYRRIAGSRQASHHDATKQHQTANINIPSLLVVAVHRPICHDSSTQSARDTRPPYALFQLDSCIYRCKSYGTTEDEFENLISAIYECGTWTTCTACCRNTPPEKDEREPCLTVENRPQQMEGTPGALQRLI